MTLTRLTYAGARARCVWPRYLYGDVEVVDTRQRRGELAQLRAVHVAHVCDDVFKQHGVRTAVVRL